MTKKYVFWGLGMALSVVFLLLLGVQFFYFSRLDKLYRQQTKQLVHFALHRVVQEVEVRELVRYLNQELKTSSHQNSKLIEALKDTRSESMRDTPITLNYPNHVRESSSVKMKSMIDSLALSDELLSTYLDNHEYFDEYILRNLYQVYSYDSIPQLVNPHLLRERLRFHLNEVGVTEPFGVSICDANGIKLYDYTQPGMKYSRVENSDEVIIQRFFVNRALRTEHSPYIKVRLDFSESTQNTMQLSIPGIAVTIFVLIIIIITVMLLYNQLSFQEMKNNFINNMTHELKTPISSIQLALEQMQHSPKIFDDSSKRHQYMTIMLSEVHRLKSLIDKVLQLSIYAKSDVMDIRLNEISIDEILLGALDTFTMRVQAESPGGTVDLQHEAENTWLMASETHMTNILYNLLENAVKYRDPSRTLHIIIRTYNTEEGNLVVEVQDNGIGVPESELKHIFKRFYRVSDGLKHDVKGYGLGLAYVASVVKRFKGTITAKNNEMGGLIIRMKFPPPPDINN